MAPSPKMPSVDPRSRCDRVHGHSPRRMRSASSATLRREAMINASGELSRRDRGIALAGRDRNPELGAGSKVDHLGISADERDELELGKPFEQSARKLHSFADRDNHLGIAQPLDSCIEIARRLAIANDIVMADQRKAFKLIDHVLIIIRNDDFHPGAHAARWSRNRSADSREYCRLS